jgi:hypothetical protein
VEGAGHSNQEAVDLIGSRNITGEGQEAGCRRARLRVAASLLIAAVVLLFPTAGVAQTIKGTVFEDQTYAGGSGRSMATAGTGAVGVSGARVELYNSAGFASSTTTSATGTYSLTTTGNGTYVVRVVNSTVISKLTGGSSAQVGVQTYRTNCTGGCTGNVGNNNPVTNYVGGQNPTVVDAAQVTTSGAAVPANAQSITTVLVSGGNSVTGVDFGFNFFTIVNTNVSGQGSLAQFVTNANALTPPSGFTIQSNFMIPDGTAHNGMNTTYTDQRSNLSGGGKAFVINMGGAVLPTVTASNIDIDASIEVTDLGGTNPNTNSLGSNSQCGPSVASGTTKLGTSQTTLPAWTGTRIPVVEIQNSGDGQWNINGSGDTVKAFAFHQATILVNGSSDTIEDNLIGMHADGTITTTTAGNYGIQLVSGSGRQIIHNFVRVNNSDIRNQSGSTGDTYQYNEVTSPLTAQTNTFDGILLVGGVNFSNDVIQYNYSHDLAGGGIEIGFGGGSPQLTNELIDNNTVCSNGNYQTGNPPYSYTNPSPERVNIAIWEVGQGSTVTISHNVITNSSGVGILIENAYGFTITQNSIYLNGLTSNNLGPGIALFSNCNTCDPNEFWGSGYTGVTPNSGTESSSSPNYQMNYPVITLATYNGGKLRVKGYVGGATKLAIANAKVELFIANNSDNNQNGQIFAGDGLSVPHGEGQTYICSFIADSTGNFDVTLPNANISGCTSFASGVSITAGSTLLTSTATDANTGSTSEFGPDVTALASALTISGYVYLDANHNGVQDSTETWQNGTTVYISLWNGTTQVGTTQTIPAGSSNDYGFYSFDDLSNSGGSYTIVLSATASPTGTGSAGAPSGFSMVNPSTPTITVSFTSSASAIVNQNFGLYHGAKLSGKVFLDNGAGTGGIANDGHWNGSEPGIANVTLNAKDSGSVLLDTEVTDGGGNFTLWLPSTAANPVSIIMTPFGLYNYSGMDLGTPSTGGTFTSSTLTYSFTVVFTNTYTGVNFGFVNGNSFAPNGAQTTVPGSAVVYSHVFISPTGGSVSFAETAAQSQPNYFGEVLYLDSTCSGNIATATYLAWGASTNIASGGGKVCILMKENVTLEATFGLQNAVTITATYSYSSGGGSSGSTVSSATATVLDTTTVGTRTSGELQLVKSVYIDTTCANPASPAYQTTPSQAQSGYCIKYQIQATNAGASGLSGLTINDVTPPYTTYQSGTAVEGVGTGCTGLTTNTVTSSGGVISAGFTGTMPAGCAATLVYEVKVN